MTETDPRDEARALIASATQVLRELMEEGVDCFERSAAPEEAQAEVHEGAAAHPAPVVHEPPAPPAAPRPAAATLEAVREELGDCARCGLCEGRRKIVFGSGNPDAQLMFVGEGPGEQEDLQGLPFVGRAGELLTQMIEKGMGISRDEVYICNIVKCRPPNNRNPLPTEVAACRPFLDGQIDAVGPKVIVTLGKPAASLLLGRDVAITRTRGTWHDYRGIPLMPTLHPAFVLRQYTPENRRNVWEDLKAAYTRARA
ncbi:MAG: uracil-DNA glycosylase [Deltaproteobacteria bacterium]|nr:uracil-DNA glycosylase [Deltaproteobacteria bacterium]MBW2421453.1 uracil-DNA glycosylase [Deltaproteobacteria bacterium]